MIKGSQSQVRRVVADLNGQYNAQLQREAATKASADAAAAAVNAAEQRVVDARRSADRARIQVRRYALDAFVRPPSVDSLAVLSIGKADDAAYASEVLKILAGKKADVMSSFREKERAAEVEKAAADRSSASAKKDAEAARAELDRLQTLKTKQDALARQLDQRLNRALAEAASLQQVNPAAGAKLASSEIAIRAAGPKTSTAAQATRSSSRSKVTATSGSKAPSTTRKAATTTPARPATVKATTPKATPVNPTPAKPTTTKPPATSTPASSPPPAADIVQWTDVTRVNGIWVNKSIAGRVQSLVNAAAAAGFKLTGGGYRDPNEQIRFRTANCGPTYYNIYQEPASQCTPPTAPPGLSMHEKGMAIDFVSNGAIVTKHSDPAWVWLSKNAAKYGLYNLPSEPWHWSTNGK